jgi:hypothetical protein
MNLGLLVIDDFYKDPHSIRSQALKMSFTAQARNLPALRSIGTLLSSEVKTLFQSTLGVDLVREAKRIPVNGCFQMMLKAHEKTSYVHADRSAQWAALVYLSPVIAPLGGTIFYRHRLTSLTQMPEKSELNQTAKDFDLSGDELKLLLRADAHNPKKWIETDLVEFRYNRFVLYNSKLFHKNGKTWGSNLENGRLTHCFFV